MTEIILIGAGEVVGIICGAVQALTIVAGVLVVGFICSQVINWLFDWAMGED